MSSNSSLKKAIGLALGTASAAVTSLAFVPTATADPADAGPTADTGDATLQEVTVTGTRIRRVDTETANSVTVIDAKAIQDSGYQTVGDIIQRLPSVSGNGVSPAVNNGGGFGESTIDLRGLDAKRTLILVDGRRQGIVGASDATDVNQIPVNMIDHIEVLTEGAGAIYGSDAVGGVVNFITKKDTDGLEFGADYGKTTHDDGPQHGFNVLFGKQIDNFHVEVGGDYFQQKAVYANRRSYSQYALYLYGGTYGAYRGGSSRTPTGRIFFPKGSALATSYGCTSVTRVLSASGASPADYTCFTDADKFNYQPDNLLTTPVERTQAFSRVSYDINEYATAYANFTFNHTHSNAEEAPLPFDSQVDDVVISKNNIYNPFGIDFGGLTTGNPDAEWRLSGLGDRVLVADTNTVVANAGVKGKLGLGDWTYDANLGYSNLTYSQSNNGYFLGSAFSAALGPSFIGAGGVPTCGTPTAPIANCTPYDIFNQQSAAANAALKSISVSVVDQDYYQYKSAELDFNGTVFPLPAGDMKAAAGFAYHGLANQFEPSALAVSSPPLYLTCLVSNEQCTSPTTGSYFSREEYVELFVPLLKDLPGVKALDLDGGVRHSDYSLFGSTTKAEFKVEYRPYADLLARGTFAQVFRVPTIEDLFSPPSNTSVTFVDPCNGLTAAKVAANPNLALACKGVPLDGSFVEPNGQITGLASGNPNLKPEQGHVWTAGFVFDPSFVKGLSINATYWNYKLDEVITTLDANYSINQCVATGSPTFCNLVTRFTTGASAGDIEVFQEPTFNLASLTTDGVDLGVTYALKGTFLGSFNFTATLTDTMSYLYTAAPGATPIQVDGTYNRQFGNFARFRGLASMAWAGWNAEALITAQYIHHELLDDPAGSGVTATGAPYPPLYIGGDVYWNASVGYNFPTKTKVLLSMQNIFDKQPPILYQNNVTNANTDVNTYDTLGRRWLVSLTQKF
jgi:outer membrane receptor protein involved in Fe transport